MTDSIYSDLNGKNVLVTGAAGGIGAAVSTAFAKQGSHVISLDLKKHPMSHLSTDVSTDKGCIYSYIVDLTNTATLIKSLAEIRSIYNTIDVIVANAGYDPRHIRLDISESEWNSLFQLNVTHYFIICRELLPVMVKNGGGSVILTSSHTAWIAKPNLIAYNTTKAAIVGLIRSLAEAYGKYYIRVNGVAPGWTMTERQLQQWVTDDALYDTINNQQAIPNVITPDQIADIYLFLASDASRAITRQVIIADAGQTKI